MKTGCVLGIDNHLFDSYYTLKWYNGKKHSRNVYAHAYYEWAGKKVESVDCVDRDSGCRDKAIEQRRWTAAGELGKAKQVKRENKKSPTKVLMNSVYVCDEAR